MSTNVERRLPLPCIHILTTITILVHRKVLAPRFMKIQNVRHDVSVCTPRSCFFFFCCFTAVGILAVTLRHLSTVTALHLSINPIILKYSKQYPLFSSPTSKKLHTFGSPTFGISLMISTCFLLYSHSNMFDIFFLCAVFTVHPASPPLPFTSPTFSYNFLPFTSPSHFLDIPSLPHTKFSPLLSIISTQCPLLPPPSALQHSVSPLFPSITQNPHWFYLSSLFSHSLFLSFILL